jgi:hypothetical protein
MVTTELAEIPSSSAHFASDRARPADFISASQLLNASGDISYVFLELFVGHGAAINVVWPHLGMMHPKEVTVPLYEAEVPLVEATTH